MVTGGGSITPCGRTYAQRMADAPDTVSPLDTKKVEGRRELRFESLEDLLVDARQLHERGYRRLGNWSLGQACNHLARPMHFGIDGFPGKPPLLLRLVLPVTIRPFKAKFLRQGFPAGLPLKGKFASAMIPEPVADDEGLRQLREGIDRVERTPPTQPSPVFGPMSPEDWRQFHLRHAELHLSFLVPE